MKKTIDPTVPHPEYKELARKYNLTLDAFMGDVAKYVPTLAGQSASEHEAYTARAAYFGVVERTAAAVVGAMTRKDFTLTGGEFPNTDYGSPTAFLQYQYRDLLLGGRTAVLVDVGDDGRSRLIAYDADDIINWSDKFKIIKQTSYQSDEDNPYELVPVTTWLELYMEEGEYKSRTWSKDKHGKPEAVQEEQLLVQGRPLDFIPLYVTTPYDNSWDVYQPPLFTQATLNIQHFKQATDIAHYAHFMALPTFCLVGDLATYETENAVIDGYPAATESGRSVTRTQATFQLGSTTTPLHLDKESSASYIEVSGSSFNMLQEFLTKIEDNMFVSGSRLLSTKKGVESVEALQVRAGAESAMLESITNSFETTLNKAFELCAVIDRTGQLTIELNKDFTAGQMDTSTTKDLLALYTANVITLDQLLDQLYQGEVVTPPNPAVQLQSAENRAESLTTSEEIAK